MKITICGSLAFATELLNIESELQKLGHEVLMPVDIHRAIENPEITMDPEHCDKFNVTMDHFKKIEQSDAILVVNATKNAISGYIGGSVLMEIGVAYYLGKKIYVLYALPSVDQIRYVVEIVHMKPILIDGDLQKIQ